MGFRYRRSARLGPLRFHFTARGLSSISLRSRGASLNIPVARRGGVRTTLSLPGTGLSWSVESEPLPVARPAGMPAARPAPATPRPARPLPNSRRLRPSQLEVFQRCCLAALHGQLFGPGSAGRALWEQQLVPRLLADPQLGERHRALLAAIATPQALEATLRRAQSQDDAKRRANRCIEAVGEASRLAKARGWLV
jgi:hypothetical protein